jgi:hypothetical protein
MNCQICKSIFPATFNIGGPKTGLFADVLAWPYGGLGGAFGERAGTFAFNFPHVVLVAMYRNGLGAKRVLDAAGELRRRRSSLIAMLKDCGAFEPGRRPDAAHLVARTRAGWSKRPEKYGPPRRLFDLNAASRRRAAIRSPEHIAAKKAEERRKNQLKYYSNLAENRAKAAASAREKYHATKRDPLSVIKRSARNLCSRIARVYGVRKKFRTQAHLGCTIPHARDHIQKQFKKGMTWDNYGEWNIDHIIPLCAFDLTRENELMQACNWRNLRPMWAEDNLAKSGSHGDVQLEIIAA